MVNNQITIKQSGTKIKVPINSIQNWTDAFINFIIIFSLKHKVKATELLKYMAIIRGAAVNNPIHKWLAYDTQFRLRMSSDPSKNWADISGHLWLSCSLSEDLTAGAQSAAPCYEYSYKGFCSRLTCTYAHICIKCKVAHPACTCSMYLESKNMNTNRTYNATQPAPFQSLGYGHNPRPTPINVPKLQELLLEYPKKSDAILLSDGFQTKRAVPSWVLIVSVPDHCLSFCFSVWL